MVALKELYPTDPDDRAMVEEVFQRYPEAKRFVERLQDHVHATFDDPAITLSTRQYDEWDPPLTVFVHAGFPLSEFEGRYLELIHWMRDDPAYDLETVAVLLRRRSTHVAS